MSDQTTSRWGLLNIVVLGILIPLIAAAVPWLLDIYSPSHDLEFSRSGPVVTKSGFAYSITISNKGRLTEDKVQAWLPVPAAPESNFREQKDGVFASTEVHPIIQVDVSVPSAKTESVSNGTELVTIPLLRPGENATVSVLAANGTIGYISGDLLKMTRVVSEATVATLDEPDKELEFAYKVGSWLFLLTFVPLAIYAFYYEHFMPQDKKEKYLLAQIDKLGKRKP